MIGEEPILLSCNPGYQSKYKREDSKEIALSLKLIDLFLLFMMLTFYLLPAFRIS